MRTGIIHLTGLAATLLFALTIIAWVDSLAGASHRIGLSSGEWELAVHSYYQQPHFAVAEWRFGPNWELDSWPELSLVRDWYTDRERQGIADIVDAQPWVHWWLHDTPEVGKGVVWEAGVGVSYSVIAISFAIPTFLHLRFLRKRKRHASAGGVESDGAAGSVDDGVSHTS